MESSGSAEVVVLGAGPAGLTAAWRAAEAGVSVTVLERAPGPGGMAASFDVAGVRVDHGSHRLHPATPPYLMAALQHLLGDDLQLRRRRGRLHLYRRWVEFPLKAGELIRAIPPSAAARIGLDALTAPLRPRQRDTYAQVLTSSLGPQLYQAMYAPYAEKLWGLPGESIDPEQARVRVTADTPWKIAAKLLRRQPSGQGRVFYYPRRGYGQITDILAEAAVEAGANLLCGTEVRQVEPGPRPTVTTAGGDSWQAGRIFSTLPLPVLARLTTPPAPSEAVTAAAGLRFRAMVLVYLVHEGGRWSAYDAHYLPGRQTPVTRISEPANYRSSVDDPGERSVLCAEIPCDVGDQVWSASDDDLAVMVREGLAATGLPPVRGAGVVVRRLPHVYPVYELGFADRLRQLETWAGDLQGVTTFGRLGLFAHDNTHHAMAMAYDAVTALGAGSQSWDAAEWSAARERFRQHVVED